MSIVENDIKKLKKFEKQKHKLDKAYSLIYGGKEIFPTEENLKKAISLKVQVDIGQSLIDAFKKKRGSNDQKIKIATSNQQGPGVIIEPSANPIFNKIKFEKE